MCHLLHGCHLVLDACDAAAAAGKAGTSLHLATMTQAASSSARRASLLHHKIKDVEAWMHDRQLPRAIRSEVTSYYADIWVASAGLHSLPPLSTAFRSPFDEGAKEAGACLDPFSSMQSIWPVLHLT